MDSNSKVMHDINQRLIVFITRQGQNVLIMTFINLVAPQRPLDDHRFKIILVIACAQ